MAKSKLTKEQREALDRLNLRQRDFVLAYTGKHAGNATRSAIEAGYKVPAEAGHRLIRNPKAAAAIALLRAPIENEAIATREEIEERLSAIARQQTQADQLSKAGIVQVGPSHGDQIRAMDQISKMRGYHSQKVELEAGNQLASVLARLPDVLERKRRREEEEE